MQPQRASGFRLMALPKGTHHGEEKGQQKDNTKEQRRTNFKKSCVEGGKADEGPKQKRQERGCIRVDTSARQEEENFVSQAIEEVIT
ncbi:MAG: hypothetical protein H6814_09055 [Phycisphaeraceae bacterium]|nr:hypothetical protein [Phycisphaeraceae bacterium]